MSESKINFYLNDKQVEANNDETIWQVANRLGTEIPHLCYADKPGYRADGNCRACMVEIEGEIVDFYEKTLLRMETGKSLAGRGNKIPRGSGYLGSVKEMKKSLEDLFNKS